MLDKTVKVILPNGEKSRLEGEQAEREGHLAWWQPTANYLIEAAANENQELILYFWLRQKEVFKLFSVLTVDRYPNNANGHDLMLLRLVSRFDPGLPRISQKNVSEALGKNPRPPLVFSGINSAAISSHVAA